MKMTILVLAVTVLSPFFAEAICSSNLREIIDTAGVEVIYRITEEGQVTFCDSYTWKQYFNAKKIADVSTFDFQNISILGKYVTIGEYENILEYLNELESSDKGRVLALLASLNNIESVEISDSLYISVFNKIVFNGNKKSVGRYSPESQAQRLMGELWYEYFLSENLNLNISICHFVSDFSVLDKFINTTVISNRAKQLSATTITFCNLDHLYGKDLHVNVNNPENY